MYLYSRSTGGVSIAIYSRRAGEVNIAIRNFKIGLDVIIARPSNRHNEITYR